MDSSRVLLALEEGKKWRERQRRIQERIRQLERRRAYLLRELEHAQKKISEYAGIVMGLKESLLTKEAPPTPHIHVR
ncbi:MAG: hypothetical protein A3K59_00795 [Euryarchaeota archaeon RBG_19FT_COMBO_69_17]|nr:MAG: hypothetical protein A3K59_00795 [Euryarchaeota archaeon RBG_19FT_COMBO_69_17]